MCHDEALRVAGACETVRQVSDWDIVLRGGRVIDPESGLDATADVAIAGDRVAEIGPGLGHTRKFLWEVFAEALFEDFEEAGDMGICVFECCFCGGFLFLSFFN